MKSSVIQCAVFGNPISHSASPWIHALFAQQFGLNVHYQKMLVPMGQLTIALQHFREANGFGANITAPFKMDAFDYADQHTERAQLAGTTNTLLFKNNICVGDNTDGIGFMRDLKKQFGEINNKNVVILGAGGAARGILPVIISEKPRHIFLWNRTPEKANDLIRQFKNIFSIEHFTSNSTIDLMINATSEPFFKYAKNKNIFYYDLNYGKHRVSFSNGCDGLGMLAEQAAESFCLWFQEKPETKSVISALRKYLKRYSR